MLGSYPMMLKFAKPKRPKGNRKAKKIRDNRFCKERLKYLHGWPCLAYGCRLVGDVHHIHDGGEPPDDFKTIPLCHFHHQGAMGIHTLGREGWEARFGSLDRLLKSTDRALVGMDFGRLVKP